MCICCNMHSFGISYSEEKLDEIYDFYDNEQYEKAIESINSLNYAYGGNQFDENLINCLTLKASSLYRIGKYDDAVDECRKILEESERLQGRFYPLYRDVCRNMGAYCKASSNYFKECVEWENLALTIDKYLGEAQNFNRLASMYQTLRENGISFNPEKVYVSMPIIFDTDCKRNWNHSNDVLYYRKCKSYVDALEKEEKNFDDTYANACLALSEAALPLGYVETAMEAAGNACEIKQSLYGHVDPKFLKAFYQYAYSVQQSGEDPFYPKTVCNSIIFTLDSIGDTQNDLYVDALILRSVGYSHVGGSGNARKDAQKAMEKAAEIAGINSQLYDRARFNRAQQEYRHGSKSTAIKLLRESLEWREQNLDKQHPENISALISLAAFLSAGASKEEAIPLYEEFMARQAINIRDNFIAMTLEEQRNYWKKFLYYYVRQIPLLFRQLTIAKPDIDASLAYNSALLSKGLLFQSERLMNNILTKKDEKIQSLIDSIGKIRQQVNILYSKGKTIEDPSIVAQLAKMSKLQDMIILGEEDYRDYIDNLYVDWKDIRSILNYGEVAIEFVEIPNSEQLYTFVEKNNEISKIPTGERDRKDYAAIIISSSDSHPRFINLFDMNDIGHFDVGDDYSNSRIAKLIWDKINQCIPEETSAIFFSPTGNLHNIPFESYYSEGDNVKLYRLTSTAQLIHRTENHFHDTAVLFGGLVYDDSDYTLALRTNSENQGEEVRRAALNNVEFLPGTAEEVDKIGYLFKGKAQVVKGSLGTESQFKNLCEDQPNVIHVATHGFYTNPREILNSSDLQVNVNFEDFAMQTSGLLFSGVADDSPTKQVNGSENDGVLTSAEISLMNLSGTNLVALSACESGLGLLGHEGIMGLQRGFKQAGANSLLMSLWKVDDEATCRLMTEFYANWLDRKMSKHDALESAKITVRETPGWEDPKYWAAFILLDALD